MLLEPDAPAALSQRERAVLRSAFPVSSQANAQTHIHFDAGEFEVLHPRTAYLLLKNGSMAASAFR